MWRFESIGAYLTSRTDVDDSREFVIKSTCFCIQSYRCAFGCVITCVTVNNDKSGNSGIVTLQLLRIGGMSESSILTILATFPCLQINFDKNHE